MGEMPRVTAETVSVRDELEAIGSLIRVLGNTVEKETRVEWVT